MSILQLEVEPFEKCPSWGGSHDKWQAILAAEAMGNTTENRQKNMISTSKIRESVIKIGIQPLKLGSQPTKL